MAEKAKVAQRYDELEAERRAETPVKADEQAQAEAVNAGEPWPGNVHQGAHQKAMTEYQSRHRAFTTALENNETEARAVIEQHRAQVAGRG